MRKLNIPHQEILAIVKGQKNTAYGYWFTEDESKITEERIKEIKAKMRLRPVTAVDLRSMKVLRFETRKEAACQLGISQSNISNAIRVKCKIVKGFLFTEDESEITEERIREIKEDVRASHSVVAVNSDTLEVSIFNSQVSAGHQLGIDPRRVNDILKGRLKKSHGSWLCRADKNVIEKARAEFGNEVAEKVEELMSKNI